MYKPAQIAALVESSGVEKARMPVVQTLTLGVLAGAFIAFGAMYFTLVMTGSGLGLGPGRMLGGLAFSLGLVLVVIAGAELFTGNNLIVMAWSSGHISCTRVFRNWGLVFAANFAGAVGCAFMMHWSGALNMGGGAVAETARNIAIGKVNLTFIEAFFRGVLCNTLVCLAVWLCYAARTVVGKFVAILLPISAFVALGFEHSVANMYLIPIGMLAGAEGVTPGGFFGNLLPVTFGNVVGGAGFVALVYWAVYLRRPGGQPRL